MPRIIYTFFLSCLLSYAHAETQPAQESMNPSSPQKQSESKSEAQKEIKAAVSQLPTKNVLFNVMPAIQEARHWLSILDKKKYDEAWEQASILVQKSITKEEFIEQAKRSREPLGSFIKRNIIMAQPRTELPGAPKGKYVLITFNSEFHNKTKVTESIMIEQDADTTWKVAGYFIL